METAVLGFQHNGTEYEGELHEVKEDSVVFINVCEWEDDFDDWVCQHTLKEFDRNEIHIY